MSYNYFKINLDFLILFTNNQLCYVWSKLEMKILKLTRGMMNKRSNLKMEEDIDIDNICFKFIMNLI